MLPFIASVCVFVSIAGVGGVYIIRERDNLW